MCRPSKVKDLAAQMLGSSLITAQTGPEGQVCNKVLINEGLTINKEMYFAIVMDREHGGPTMVASKHGGMDIEEVAHKTPDEIFVVRFPHQWGLFADRNLLIHIL